jgi:hypothetical protein
MTVREMTPALRRVWRCTMRFDARRGPIIIGGPDPSKTRFRNEKAVRTRGSAEPGVK